MVVAETEVDREPVSRVDRLLEEDPQHPVFERLRLKQVAGPVREGPDDTAAETVVLDVRVLVFPGVVRVVEPRRDAGDQRARAEQFVVVGELQVGPEHVRARVVVDGAGHRVVVVPAVEVEAGLEDEVAPLLFQAAVEEEDLGVAAVVLPGRHRVALLARRLEGLELRLVHGGGQLHVGLGVAELRLQRRVAGEEQAVLQPDLGGVELVPLAPVVLLLAVGRGQGQGIALADLAAEPGVGRERAEAAGAQLHPVGGRVEHRAGDDLERAAGGPGAVERTRPLGDLDALDVLGVDVVEAGEAVGVGHGHAVPKHHDLAHPVVGLLARASNDQSDVVAAVPAVDQDTRYAPDRLLDVEHALGLQALLADDGDGTGGLSGASNQPRRGDVDGVECRHLGGCIGFLPLRGGAGEQQRQAREAKRPSRGVEWVSHR